MSKHTPGPWRLNLSSKGWQNPFQIERADGACLFSFGESPFHGDAEADARLIAAAPELLSVAAAAEALISGDLVGAQWKQACADFVKQARAVIAKAEGR